MKKRVIIILSLFLSILYAEEQKTTEQLEKHIKSLEKKIIGLENKVNNMEAKLEEILTEITEIKETDGKLSQQEYKEFLKEIRSTRRAEEKVKIIGRHKATYGLTVPQVIDILDQETFKSDKEKLLRMIYSYIDDKENTIMILEYLN